jgi:hypothetical protein
MKHNVTFVVFLIFIKSYGQAPKINLEATYSSNLEKKIVSIIDSNDIYINDGVSKSLFYYALIPKSNIKGVMVLFPSTGELVEEVINNNINLSKLACDSSLLTIIPSINNNLCVDQFSLKIINSIFNNVINKYNPPKDKFVIGGFSLGGMNALRYTEMSYQDKTLAIVQPKAVYGVDPPVDLVGVYYTFTRTIVRNAFAPAVSEAKDYVNKMHSQFGGTPQDKVDVYNLNSMYSRNQKNGGNTQYLKTVPVRIYSDPDIDWQMKYRYSDYYDMNALDQTAMINQLKLLGNNKAEFINALGKGYRLNGMRHPHSWSLLEPTDCIHWILICIQ